MKAVMKNIKKYVCVLSLVTTSVLSLAQAIEMDKETQDLILDSIHLELVHNSTLKDPVDNLPLGLDEAKMKVFGLSVDISSEDGSATFLYQVEIPFTTVDGEEGTLLCTASYVDVNDTKKAKRASCFINSSTGIPNDDRDDEWIDFDILFDEF